VGVGATRESGFRERLTRGRRISATGGPTTKSAPPLSPHHRSLLQDCHVLVRQTSPVLHCLSACASVPMLCFGGPNAAPKIPSVLVMFRKCTNSVSTRPLSSASASPILCAPLLCSSSRQQPSTWGRRAATCRLQLPAQGPGGTPPVYQMPAGELTERVWVPGPRGRT